TKQYDGIHVHYESHPTYRSANNSSSSASSSQASSQSNSFNSGKSSHNNNKRSSKQSKQNNGKSQLIFNQQQQMLVNHLDCITDLKISELPYPMLISADRDGIVKSLSEGREIFLSLNKLL
ncbi:14868_t:CDS:2, partial [Acaulospora morrowiae]